MPLNVEDSEDFLVQRKHKLLIEETFNLQENSLSYLEKKRALADHNSVFLIFNVGFNTTFLQFVATIHKIDILVDNVTGDDG